MEYKIHQYRFDNFTRYEDIIRQALNQLGYTETDSPIHGLAGLNIYNHCHISEVFTDNNIYFILTHQFNVMRNFEGSP